MTRLRGFTLLELLIAVAIFSGLAVLALGIFARSASSSLKTAESRARTEVTRSIVDRITSDLRLTDSTQTLTNVHEQVSPACKSGAISIEVKGYDFQENCLVMVLNFPSDPEGEYVWKMYERTADSGAIIAREKRGCTAVSRGGQLRLSCPQNSGGSSELIGAESDQFTSEDLSFTGLNPLQAETERTVTIPFLQMSLTIKPKGLAQTCIESSSQCYTVSTTISRN